MRKIARRLVPLATIVMAAAVSNGCGDKLCGVRIWALNTTSEPFHINGEKVLPGDRMLAASGNAYSRGLGDWNFKGSFTLTRNGSSIGTLKYDCKPIRSLPNGYDVEIQFATGALGELHAYVVPGWEPYDNCELVLP